MQAFFTDGNTKHCTDVGQFIDRIHSPTQINTTQTSVYMCVWLAPHQLLRLSGWAVISQWTVTFWKLAPRSSSLSLCISVSPHHSGGRPTKAFVLQWAVQQKLHKYCMPIAFCWWRRKKRLRREKERLRLRKEEKYNYGRGKAAW